MVKQVVLLFSSMLILGCRHDKFPIIHISLINNSKSLQFTGLDAAIIGEISRDSSIQVWQNLIPVYRMPADTDLKDYQPAQPGKYTVVDNAVVFTPDTPFAKNQSYFVRYYQYGAGHSIWEHISHHTKIDKQQYTDLIFKQ
jgi:hypothetical protein